MSRPAQPPSAALMNARYIAIRTAEAEGLSHRLLEAARDRTPGMRRMLAPLLYRYWVHHREDAWQLFERIAAGSVRFPGLVDREAIVLLCEVSMPVLNACRQEPAELTRLAAIWQAQMSAVFGSPLAKAGRLLARRWMLKAGANAFGEVMKRQPAYQLVNYQELEVTFARPDSFRRMWSEALSCLERPELGHEAVAAILSDPALPYDLYLMLICERVLVYQGVKGDTAAVIDLLERLFQEGCPWFRQSILYALFHILRVQPAVEDAMLDRYDALAREFFASGSWRLTTSRATYEFAAITANSDVVAFGHRPERPPRVVPALLEQAISSGNGEELAALFGAIDGVAFYHGNGALALELLRHAYELGGKAIEPRIVASLATVRLQNQLLVDAFISQHRLFAGISPAYVAAKEPSVSEEDLVTLIDGFVIHMLLNSAYFRGQICAAYRRALDVRSVEEFLMQIMEWVRDELAHLPRP